MHLPPTATRLFIATQPNPYGMGSKWQPSALQTAWQALVPNMLSWQPLDTDHYGIVASPSVQTIAKIINNDLIEHTHGERHERT